MNFRRRMVPHNEGLQPTIPPNRVGLVHHSKSEVQCPLWVKSRHVQCTSPCPLYPRKRHQMRQMGVSAKGQKADISAGKLAGNVMRGCLQGSHMVRQSRAVVRVCWMTFLSLLVNCVGPGSTVNLLSVPVKRKGGW